MDICAVCGGSEFYIEAGYYFCNECQTKHEGKIEEYTDFHVDPATRVRKTRLRKDKSSSGGEPIVGWTSWEQFNFILIGLTNELIELGASPDIKMTVLQLWATYLGKLEVAFTSTLKKTVPKLARKYNKKDAEIIYGRILRKKKRKRSKNGGSAASCSSMVSSYASGGSSRAEFLKHKRKLVTSEYNRYMQSQNSEIDTVSVTNQSSVSGVSGASETSIVCGEKLQFNKCAKLEKKKVNELAKKLPRLQRKKFREKHVTATYHNGPQIITTAKLWSLLYLALRINDDKIHLSDMLRFAREGHLSYYRLEHLLPPEVCLSKVEISRLTSNRDVSHKGLNQRLTKLAKFLGVLQLPHPNLLSLIERYVTELQLPNGILLYAERMMATSPPIMDFGFRSTSYPNFESRAMAFIIVVMKILFGLDGITEYEISRVVDRINTSKKDMAKSCLTDTTKSPCIIVCGSLLSENDPLLMEKVSACIKSACRGYKRLLRKGTAIDAIEDALWWLECDELFNCGYGSVPNFQGEVEMDACIMNGLKMKCGSAVALRNVEHPIKIARHLMENYPNQIFSNELILKLPTLSCDNWVSPGYMLAPLSEDREQITNLTKIAEERGELESRLFSFCEWQRYIECRRSILVKEHFPTKLKRDPHSAGTSHLYVKFIQSIQSKYEGDEPEIQHFDTIIQRDIANMMKKNFERLNENMPSTKDAVVFPPSLTSQHTYLQQLLADPDRDMPSILRQANFPATKVGYMLKPESLEHLAAQCNIELRVVTASAHFMEKIVETFVPPGVPPIRDQKTMNYPNAPTRVIAPDPEASSKTNKIDDPSEYLHRKYPGRIVIDAKKQRLYCKSRATVKNNCDEDSNDFEFDQVRPNGKLKIPKSDDESEDELSVLNDVEKDYRLILSKFERQTMLNPIKNPWEKCKKTPYRSKRGPFIKKSIATETEIMNWEIEKNQLKSRIRREVLIGDRNFEDLNNLKHTDENDPIIVKEILVHEPEINGCESDEISILTESIDPRHSSNIAKDATTPEREVLILFRPYKQYWLHRCSRMAHASPQSFQYLERDLPINFRWLLHECAHILEMNSEDLYVDVCLIESYYGDVLSPNYDPELCKKYDTTEYRSPGHLTIVRKKWKT